MLSYKKASNNATQFLSLTSLNLAEFDVLLKSFSDLWHYRMRYFTFTGKAGKHAYSEKQNAKISFVEGKLFFWYTI